MVSNFAVNTEEIALIQNYRKLTTDQRETINRMLAGIAYDHTSKMSLVVNNVRSLNETQTHGAG